MIQIENLNKQFGAVTAVEDVSFNVEEGQICVLLGPSGCGKTTTLKMINRLITPTSGTIRINGRDTSELDSVTLKRSIGYVIQQVGLFPNMTVEENICVVPNLLGWDKSKSRKRAAELLEVVALDPAKFLKRYPCELSGGQQQRIGVARALAADPPLMLMDEPFGAIDPINREVIQDEFMRIQRLVNKTVLFVSHDIDEAVKMADCVALFHNGKIQQFGSSDDLLALAMSLIGVGSGAAIIGLFVATLLPVAVNTYEGLRAVPQHLVEAVEAMGMTPRETLWKVEIPNALNVIFAGIRTALAINVGTAPLAFLVGGGGLGELIFTGIDLNDFGMMLAGAVSTALLAIAVDLGCGLIQTVAVSRGLRMAGRQ